VQQEPAPNTALQAAWIAERVLELGIRSFALTVSPYHLPRTYLTVIKALLDRGVRIPMVPAPAHTPPHLEVLKTGATAYDLIPGEMQRILSYADNGWVATPKELRAYLVWLWANHRSLFAEL
jgi:uncharacterized SAM-binding protein YcdF (DUF218 family)